MRSALLLLPLLLTASPPSPLVQVEVKDVVPLKELNQHAVVLVSKEDGMVLPLFVDETAAVAIAFRLMGRPTPHPLAHDLLDRIVPTLGGRLTEVRIDGLKDHIYQSHVVIQQANKQLVIEARPSDAVSMALAAKVPVYTTREVMAVGGISRAEIDSFGKEPADPGPGVGGSGSAGTAPAPDSPRGPAAPSKAPATGTPVQL
ncbi:MAG TPA: bifunctional nuclease family protein [Myxococcaceae bacterium]